jgi:hypothetical protein
VPEQLKELDDLRVMGQEGILVTLINIRHDVSDMRTELKETNEKIARIRDFEAKTSGQFGVLKGVGSSFGAVFIAVLGWSISQIWSHSIAVAGLPTLENRITTVEHAEAFIPDFQRTLDANKTAVDRLDRTQNAIGLRVDALEQHAASHK